MAKKSVIAQSSRELKKLRLKDIVEYENNPRVIENAIPKVVESIKQCGYITPIVVDENNVILAGHTRINALKELGVEKVDVIVVKGLNEKQKGKYRLLDNKTGEVAQWDNEKLAEELKDIDFNGFDFGQIKINTRSFIENEGGQSESIIICPRCKSEVSR